MTEKTEYIAASIDLLEQEDELNSTELAVLCNLKKYMNKSDHQPIFEVGEYYSYKSLENVLHILKITAVMGDIVEAEFLNTQTGKLVNTRIELDKKYVQPATTEQIATFKRAEHFAAHGRKLDEFRVGDKVNCSEIPFDNGYYTGEVVIQGFGKKTFVAGLEKGLHLYNLGDLNKVTLIQTAEELREVGV